MNFLKIIISILVINSICLTLPTYAQSRLDSIQHLGEVTVTAKTYKEVIPSQKLTGEELKALSSFSVADAIRYFSGIQVKDYGGLGGMKTVNIRSMGTEHVGVFYDGIQLGNAQNGIVDLGKFSLDNMEEISLYNGQKSEIFQPAKDFGSSGSIYLRSRTPRFVRNKKYNLRTMLKGGSFDLVNPSLLYEYKISEKVKASFSGELINSSGKYKFRVKRVYPGTHTTAYDTTAVRQNGDIFSYRLEAGLYGAISEGTWRIKSYYYKSNRGLPGAVVAVADGIQWKNSQRQRDENVFVQGSLQKKITKRYELLANAKFAYDYMRFMSFDPTFMLIDNSYYQREWYVSIANNYAITRNWDVSLAGDMQYNTLSSDRKGFTPPQRLTTLLSAASAIELGKVKIQGSVLATLIDEHIKLVNTNSGDGPQQFDTTVVAPNKYELTPAFFISYKPFADKDFNVRAFYKHIFRMPTFNDLYYTNMGNSALEPEYTRQFNLGFQYGKPMGSSLLQYIQFRADVYYNRVTNKIVAIPAKSNMQRWTMVNLGLVKIRGVNITSSSIFRLPPDIILNLKLAYTYEKAQDYTISKSPEVTKKTYKGQIPYAPWHSGSVIANLAYKSWSLNYSFIYVGERYDSSENGNDFYEQPWYTHDMSVVKQFKVRNIGMKVSGEINNIFAQGYNVVKNYPMPERNYKISLTIEL